MPKEIVLSEAERIDPSLIIKEKNVEVRREMVRKIGIERVIKKLHADIIDKWNDYELLKLPKFENMQNQPVYLKMKNPSLGIYHIEGVPPNIKTCQEALNWRIGGITWNPEQLT